MKKLIFILIGALVLTACQNAQQRYTQSSNEIDVLKAVINSYDDKDWDALVSQYADTAKVYFNSTTPIEIAKVPAFHQQDDANLAQRSFEKDGLEYEMVIDDKGNTWVNFWGTWKGTLAANGKEIEIPVHLTAHYINGKIVREYGYWDNSPILLALQEIQAKAEATDDMGEKE
ncbi:MAG: nuclear transport factor 2 family protein [Flavobacteriaceae bacterium]|nr:nuclear transport factor 2 family protein [Flavobacteriaceae bacterium]